MTLEETYYEINRILDNNAEPLESVRLVEDLTNDPHHPRRDGTPQFWKVLYACDNRVRALRTSGLSWGDVIPTAAAE